MITTQDLEKTRAEVVKRLDRCSEDGDYETAFELAIHIGDRRLPNLPLFGRDAPRMKVFLLGFFDLLIMESEAADLEAMSADEYSDA